MEKHNLQPKCITDFTPEDTIYITIEESKGFPTTFLCQFKEQIGRSIFGKVLESTINHSSYKREIEDGWEISARLNKCSLYGKNPVSGHTHYHWFKDTGYAIYPSEYLKDDVNATIIKEHPSFGMIALSRRSSSHGVPLFGSSIQNKETMTITLSSAEVDRHLNNEWYHSRKTLFEVEMSATQFAEFITTPNTGSGIPCTVRQVGMKSMPQPPYESRMDMFNQEFSSEMKNIATSLSSDDEVLKNILDKKSLTKGDREEIAKIFDNYKNKVSSSLPFVAKQFSEQMDKTVLEAKGQVESFINRRLTEAGKKALLGQDGNQPLITE